MGCSFRDFANLGPNGADVGTVSTLVSKGSALTSVQHDSAFVPASSVAVRLTTWLMVIAGLHVISCALHSLLMPTDIYCRKSCNPCLLLCLHFSASKLNPVTLSKIRYSLAQNCSLYYVRPTCRPKYISIFPAAARPFLPLFGHEVEPFSRGLCLGNSHHLYSSNTGRRPGVCSIRP